MQSFDESLHINVIEKLTTTVLITKSKDEDHNKVHAFIHEHVCNSMFVI